jgi:hypothetical protein
LKLRSYIHLFLQTNGKIITNGKGLNIFQNWGYFIARRIIK